MSRQQPRRQRRRILSVPIIDALSLALVANVHIVACGELDSTCAQPVAEATSGGDGVAKFRVPADFKGYLQQTQRSDYTPTIYSLPSVFPAAGVLPDFPLFTSGTTMRGLVLALGREPDPQRGGLVDVIARDCFGAGVSDVTFSTPQLDMSTVQYYVADALPSSAATATEADGHGGFLHLPAGTAVISAKTTQTGLDLGSVRVPVRAGFNSIAYVRPPNR